MKVFHMTSKKGSADRERLAKIVAEARRHREERELNFISS